MAAPKRQSPPRSVNGLKYLRTVYKSDKRISCVAWDPTSERLAICHPEEGELIIVDAGKGEVLREFDLRGVDGATRNRFPFDACWNNDGTRIALASPFTAVVLDAQSGMVEEKYRIREQEQGEQVYPSICFSGASGKLVSNSGGIVNVDGSLVGPPIEDLGESIMGSSMAMGSGDVIYLVTRNRLVKLDCRRKSHVQSSLSAITRCFGAAYSGKKKVIACSSESDIWIMDEAKLRNVGILSEHRKTVESLTFSADGAYLFSRALDEVGILWSTDGWRKIGEIPFQTSGQWPARIGFHPSQPLLATLDEGDCEVRIWRLEETKTQRGQAAQKNSRYVNAKVVLVGNTGVGKSGLGLTLSGRKFKPTKSTHGRHVWPMVREDKSTDEDRETLLWDLAGQPGYRLIHQLHLHEVAVALVLFDSRSEIDPFAGIGYWARALDDATRGFPLVKILVAARCDRGTPPVSKSRIQEVKKKYGFKAFFETSAQEGIGIEELREKVISSIPWKQLPFVSTNIVFRRAKAFMVELKRKGEVLVTESKLRDRFGHNRATLDENLFAACVGRLESAGLVRRLSFGNYVLLQPELFDAYCGWMAIAARKEPDGLGYLQERKALHGKFEMDGDRMLKDQEDERSLLLAAVEELVERKLAFREETPQGAVLVFPSEMNADLPSYPGGYSLAAAFTFEGPVSGIYATLAVQLVHSDSFDKKALYRNASLFKGPKNQICGFAVEYPDPQNDSVGRLVVFFDHDVEEGLKLIFLRYVDKQLRRLAFRESVERERIYHCSDCSYTMPQTVVASRIKKGKTTVLCPCCDRHYPINDLMESPDSADEEVREIEVSAELEKERQSRLTVLPQKEKEDEYHVFLCHNSKDKPVVHKIHAKLREQGVLAWFDKDRVLGGDNIPRDLEKAIERTPVMAVLIGPNKLGGWQAAEYHSALVRFIEDREASDKPRVRLIPVLLPGAAGNQELPTFLRTLHSIDLRQKGADNREGIQQLVRAIFQRGLE